MHDGRKLLIPTNKEEIEQGHFEEKWRTVGALSASQEIAEKRHRRDFKSYLSGSKNKCPYSSKIIPSVWSRNISRRI